MYMQAFARLHIAMCSRTVPRTVCRTWAVLHARCEWDAVKSHEKDVAMFTSIGFGQAASDSTGSRRKGVVQTEQDFVYRGSFFKLGRFLSKAVIDSRGTQLQLGRHVIRRAPHRHST